LRKYNIEDYPAYLPNENFNYSNSPAARHAMKDGSLDPNQTFFGRSFNRKLKMRDTFTKIFPSYNHGQDTTYSNPNKSYTHWAHVYPKRDDYGKRMHAINREYTHKKSESKIYHESMLKISDMLMTRSSKKP